MNANIIIEKLFSNLQNNSLEDIRIRFARLMITENSIPDSCRICAFRSLDATDKWKWICSFYKNNFNNPICTVTDFIKYLLEVI